MLRMKEIRERGKRILVFETTGELERYCAETIIRVSNDEVRRKGVFSLVLSGGTTPRGIYQILASRGFRDRIPWKGVHLFWGDERCVAMDHPDSNFHMAYVNLISNVPIPEENIHRVRTELPPQRASALYEKEIRDFFGGEDVAFDLVLLGLGRDGHTLSIFPFTEAVDVTDRLFVANYVETLDTYRLTMTYRAVNNARMVIFLVTGREKAEIVRDVLSSPVRKEKYPAQGVEPKTGNLLWLLDSGSGRLIVGGR